MRRLRPGIVMPPDPHRRCAELDHGRQRPAGPDRWFWVAGSLWLFSLVMTGWVGIADPVSLGLSAFTTVGALAAWLRPRNPVGWLLLADGLVWLGGGAAAQYAMAPDPPGPAAEAAAAFFDLMGWVVAVGLIPLVLLVFPSGRAPTRRWRLVGWMIVGGGGVLGLANLLTPGPLPSFPELSNPFGVEALRDLAPMLAAGAEVVFFLGIVGALAAVLVRFRRSSGLERQQLRWLAFAAVLLAAGFTTGNVANAFGLPAAWAFYVTPMFAVAIAVGIALLRYRLWDLDLVVAGTLTYGLLALAFTAIYVFLLAGLGVLIGTGTRGDVWLAVLGTAIAAALFQPLREAAQDSVRRVLFRAPQEVEQAPIRIRTLGGFRVERAGRPVSASEWQSRRARQLLKMLVAQRGRPVHREQLIEALWPDEATGNLANRLAVAASTVRAVLDPEKAYPSDYFVTGDADTLRLDLEHIAVDVEQFLALAEAELHTRGPGLERAEAMYRGDFLEEDRYEEWSQPLREEARATYLAVLRARAEVEQGRSADAAIAAHLRILEIDPWDERAHLGIVSALAAAGRHGEARRAYSRYEARMQELGVSPARV